MTQESDEAVLTAVQQRFRAHEARLLERLNLPALVEHLAKHMVEQILVEERERDARNSELAATERSAPATFVVNCELCGEAHELECPLAPIDARLRAAAADVQSFHALRDSAPTEEGTR